MKPAAKPQAKTEKPEQAPRPTIALQNVIVTAPDTAAFSGWGPKVAGAGSIVKNWN